MVYRQLKICPRKGDAQNWNKNGSPNLDQTTRPSDCQKKGTFWIVDFVVPSYHKVKLKESEKGDKYLDLARELKKLWNKKVIVVNKGLVQGLEELEIRGQLKTVQTTALRSARILQRVLETRGDLQSLRLLWKAII